MAVKNFLQTNKVPVGTTSNKPLWEQLGYSSPQEPMKARITERVISSKPSKKITVTITTAILLREERVCRTALGTLSNRSINTTSKGKTMRRKGIARLQAKINIIKGKKTRFPKRSTLRDRHSERTRARLNKMQAFPSINF